MNRFRSLDLGTAKTAAVRTEPARRDLLATGDARGASRAFDRASALSCGDWLVPVEIARSWRLARNAGFALASADAATRAGAGEMRAWRELGECALLAGDFPRA